MLPTVTLIPTTGADADFFFEVVEKTMREHVIATFGEWNAERVKTGIAKECQSPHCHLIHANGIRVGVVAVEKTPAEIRLQQLFILPEFQKQGIGKGIVKNLIAEACAQHLSVTLRVIRANPARAFYEKQGFKIVSESDTYYYLERC